MRKDLARKHLATLITGLAVTLGGAQVCNAGLMVTWSDAGGALNLSIKGDWSTWESSTTLTSTDSLLFKANGTTPFAFNLSRGNISGVGRSVIMDVVSGSGSVTADDFFFGPPLPTTGYNLVHLNEGGSLALEAEVASGGTFTIDESFILGSTFDLTPGTRTFRIASGSDVLTMNYVTAAVPEPVSLALFGLGLGTFAWTRRRRNGTPCASTTKPV